MKILWESYMAIIQHALYFILFYLFLLLVDNINFFILDLDLFISTTPSYS